MLRKLIVIRRSSHRFVHICLQLNFDILVHRGAHIPRAVVIRATKFCTVSPKIFSLIIAVFCLRIKMCVISLAPGGTRQITASFRSTKDLWVLRIELDLYQPSGAGKFGSDCIFMDNLWTSGLTYRILSVT